MENFTYLPPIKPGRGLCLLLISLFAFSGLAAQKLPLQVSANTIEAYCGGEGHVIALQATGGEAPYAYHWQDGVEGNFRKNLASGTYVCIIKDANGNAVSKQFNFAAKPAPLELNYVQEKAQDGSASIALQVNGGKLPYSFVWIGPGIDSQASQKTEKQVGLQPGTYLVVVQDANKCTANVTVNIK